MIVKMISLKALGIVFLFCFVKVKSSSNHHHLPECSSYDDPHMSTFDGRNYEFQYPGDHFIMYDDFKETRVTAGYQSCWGATCNCAIYLKKGRKIVFVDFCGVTNDLSPTSQLYGVHLEKNSTGLNAIKKMPRCKVIGPKDENDERVWKNIPTFLNDFKCALLQGSNHYEQYVLRTVEKHFEDSVKVKFRLSTRSLPALILSPSKSSFENTGGLCGLWDNNRDKELFVLDIDGVEHFLPDTNNVELARDFWKMASRYNKPEQNGLKKRCPECYTVSERAFYCPCDNFDMFDITNYNIPRPVPERDTFCKVPMFKCIEQLNNIVDPNPTETTTRDPSITTTTRKPITLEEAEEECLQAFLANEQIGPLIENGCLDANFTLELCALDLFSNNNEWLIAMHIQNLIDNSIQNILDENPSCNETDITTLCPNNCTGNGVCVFKEECLDPSRFLFDRSNRNDEDDCASPVRCECNTGYGGNDCSIDLTTIVDFNLNKDCCDLRNDECDEIDIFGFPFSVKDKIYAKIEIIENGVGDIRVTETIELATIYSSNNLNVKIRNINDLALFKNINNLPNDFTLFESTTLVNIYLSYSNSSFEKSKSFRLYDSKCRDCNKNSQSTWLLDHKCEIDGVCYNYLENNPSDDEESCRPEINIFEWTDLSCYGEYKWSEWYDLDKPDGDGDIEVTEVLEVGCKSASRFQARTVNDKVPHTQTGQKVYLDECYGFICLNDENRSPCLNYEVRKCCRK